MAYKTNVEERKSLLVVKLQQITYFKSFIQNFYFQK